MYGDRGGLDHRSLDIGDLVREYRDLMLCDDGELCHSAPRPVQSHRPQSLTSLRATAPTGSAAAAEEQRHHGDAVAWLDRRDLVADREHIRRELMPEDLR